MIETREVKIEDLTPQTAEEFRLSFEDDKRLAGDSFLNRTVNSIVNNGIKKTAFNYNLKTSLLESIAKEFKLNPAKHF